MKVEILAARLEHRPLFARLMQLYAYDFTEVTGADVDEDGVLRAPPVDACWTEPGRAPFLIRCDSACAGFVILGAQSRLVERRVCRDVEEFFVLRKYRRAGVGTRAATLAFDAFRGPWEVRQLARATDASAFWRKVVARYTAGRFRELMWDDARWRGPVQMFDNGDAS
jgi:predicted acetyltransferase